MSKDPVCGTTLEPSQAAAQSEFEGETYYFCRTDCEQQFRAHPQQYAATKQVSPGVPCCGFGMGMVRRTTQRGVA